MAENKEEAEINLLELTNKLWIKRKFIIKASLVGFVIGIIIAFSIPKEYTTKVVLLTEAAKSTSGNMGALASMAGINLGSAIGEDIFSTDSYPDVLNSTYFIQGLLDINVIDNSQNINTKLYDYLKDEQKTAWWNYILMSPKLLLGLISSQEESSLAENNFFISKEEMDIIEYLRESYTISTDKKTAVTTIEVTFQSPVISAFLADTITSYLQSYIIEQRTKKATNSLLSNEKLYEQSKTAYYDAQQKLASFVDGNLNITSAKYRINQEKLQSEASITSAVYNQMAQQVQMSKIKVQDATPVFTIIQPAVIPINPTSPNKKLIVIVFTFLTFICACGWILKRDDLLNLKNSILEKENVEEKSILID